MKPFKTYMPKQNLEQIKLDENVKGITIGNFVGSLNSGSNL